MATESALLHFMGKDMTSQKAVWKYMLLLVEEKYLIIIINAVLTCINMTRHSVRASLTVGNNSVASRSQL